MRYLFLRTLALILLFSITIAQSALAGLIRDTELETGLQTLAAPLMRAAGYTPDAISIRIIIDSSYNAFVAGERIIYIHSGLLLNAQSTEEVLGVIAHELGHLKAGHVPRRDEALRDAGTAGTLAAIAAIALTASGAPNDAAVGVMVGGADQAQRKMFRSFRYDEAVADELGLDYLDKAGISSAGLEQMMRRMAAQSALPESRQSQYYQSHPDPAQRLAVYQDHASKEGHKSAPLSADSTNLMNRLVAKLRAFSEPVHRILRQTIKTDSADAIYSHAIAQYRRGDLAAAIIFMDQLCAAHPADPFYHEFRGDILLSMPNAEAAAAAYETALTFRPDSPQILVNLGRALIATNDKKRLLRAIEAISAAQKTEPKWAFIRRQLAIAYGRNGDIAAADLALAEEAILLGNDQQAVRMAKRVLTDDNLKDDLRNRANDILFRFGKLAP
ncbi:M48 family metalloprotease [Alphaproteobacteria bacterium]|nr:M48 family metalloprotease [Alphaproteobacteria bacterium]